MKDTEIEYEKTNSNYPFAGYSKRMGAPIQAQAIAAPKQAVSVFLGGAVALGHSGLMEKEVDPDSDGNDALDWGSLAGSYSLQYIYRVHDRWSFGLEYNGNNFDDALQNRGILFPPFSWWERDIESRMNVHNMLAVGRFTFNPQSRVLFYVPFGAGVARSKGTLEVSETNLVTSQYFHSKTTAMDTSFAYYLGLGMEKQFASHWAWGLEVRYQGFWFDNGGYQLAGVSGKEHHGYLSGLFKLSYLF